MRYDHMASCFVNPLRFGGTRELSPAAVQRAARYATLNRPGAPHFIIKLTSREVNGYDRRPMAVCFAARLAFATACVNCCVGLRRIRLEHVFDFGRDVCMIGPRFLIKLATA